MDQEKSIVAFGEILWDLLPGGRVLGGAPFNFAFRTHECGNRSLMVSRLGEDDLGREARAWTEELGMDTSLIQSDAEYPTGTVEVTLDENQQPDYFIVPDVAYDHVETNEAVLHAAREADCICFGTLAQRHLKSRRTLQEMLKATQKAVKLLDINLRKECFTRESIVSSLQQANILKLNEDEARFLSLLFQMEDGGLERIGENCLHDWSLDVCLITVGDRGVLALSSQGERVYLPGYWIQLVDPLGSGDAFTAGFVNEYLQGKPLTDCCRFGNAYGALAATRTGATGPISKEEIKTLIENPPQLSIDEDLKSWMAEA